MVPPYRIIGHTPVEVCAVIEVEVVILDHVNHIICCTQMVTTQTRALLGDNGGLSGVSILVFRLGIPGSHIIVILFPSIPIVPSVGPSNPSSSAAFSYSYS